jgi:signal transduction histidine kinase
MINKNLDMFMKRNLVLNKSNIKILFIVILVGAIASLHYSTQYSQIYHHIVYRELYFLPLILGGFWFGLRGGLITSFSIVASYMPFVILRWDSFSPDDLDKSIEIILFIVVAVLVGTLRDREKARMMEKIESVKAMAGTVAHELNTPLQVVLGNSQLLQEEFDSSTETHVELQGIINNLRKMDQIIKKISFIDRVELKDYVGNTKILDIEKTNQAGTKA